MATYDTDDTPIYDFTGNAFSNEGVKEANAVVNILNGEKLLEGNEALVFTGDLLDRGPHGIRLMQRFIDLKRKNKEQVLLCAGNRDFNKIRMLDELFVVNQKLV